jgi:hypothetical protein
LRGALFDRRDRPSHQLEAHGRLRETFRATVTGRQRLQPVHRPSPRNGHAITRDDIETTVLSRSRARSAPAGFGLLLQCASLNANAFSACNPADIGAGSYFLAIKIRRRQYRHPFVFIAKNCSRWGSLINRTRGQKPRYRLVNEEKLGDGS